MPRSAVTLHNITLSPDAAELVRRKLASGEFASESEVISEGLRSLADSETNLERWLREDVAPTYDSVMANPASETVSTGEVFDGLRDRHAERVAKTGA